MKTYLYGTGISDAFDLSLFLLNVSKPDGVIYVRDEEGRIFNHVCLREERLSDGSIVRDVVLSAVDVEAAEREQRMVEAYVEEGLHGRR